MLKSLERTIGYAGHHARRWMRLLERLERDGRISEEELVARATSLVAFATAGGVRSWKFRTAVLNQCAVDGQ